MTKPTINMILGDCLPFMTGVPDRYYDLAIVDPPYGIGQNWKKDRSAKFYAHENKFNDTIPSESYFTELFRISKNQIIWGCNYYWNYLPTTNNLIYWRKGKDAIRQFGSSGELAWTSFKKYPLLEIDLPWNGCIVCERTEKIHPHQKPVALYKWMLETYAKKGDLILDTHGGSFSNAIACYNLGFDLDVIELDPDYYSSSKNRFDDHVRACREIKQFGYAKTALSKTNPVLF